MPLLEIENLSVAFPSRNGMLRAVDGVSMTLDKGEVLGIVGESGSGKSVGMLALMGLVPHPGRVEADRLRFEGKDLQRLSER
ncbi:MAG: ATP-binding cassette domain-containing protein, partial [Bradyrhizobium sp.]|nr:ATP-binding cassette domain-containing protein [Bradyrhizobium sp.]